MLHTLACNSYAILAYIDYLHVSQSRYRGLSRDVSCYNHYTEIISNRQTPSPHLHTEGVWGDEAKQQHTIRLTHGEFNLACKLSPGHDGIMPLVVGCTTA